MRISKELEKAINEQITAELWSANLYLSMSFHVEGLGFSGFAAWLKGQAMEETDHAHEFAAYLISRGGAARVDAIDKVPHVWDSIEKLFEEVYEHECYVSDLINKLMTLAIEEKDYPSQDFLYKFVREQVEEEDSSSAILDQIRLAGPNGLFYIDKHIERPVHEGEA